MDTAWPIHYDIKETISVVCCCLYVQRVPVLPILVVCSLLVVECQCGYHLQLQDTEETHVVCETLSPSLPHPVLFLGI